MKINVVMLVEAAGLALSAICGCNPHRRSAPDPHDYSRF